MISQKEDEAIIALEEKTKEQKKADNEKQEADERINALQEQVQNLIFAIKIIFALFVVAMLSQAREPFFEFVQYLFSLKYLDYLPSIQIHAPKESLLSSEDTVIPVPEL